MIRVLLVEDSADVLYVMQLELEMLGHQVDAFTDANAALTFLEDTVPDLIVSDLGMPLLDGFEFIRRVRKREKLASVPAIALTGASRDEDIQRALACGFTTHLVKPVDMTDLEKHIDLLTSGDLRRKAS